MARFSFLLLFIIVLSPRWATCTKAPDPKASIESYVNQMNWNCPDYDPDTCTKANNYRGYIAWNVSFITCKAKDRKVYCDLHTNWKVDSYPITACRFSDVGGFLVPTNKFDADYKIVSNETLGEEGVCYSVYIKKIDDETIEVLSVKWDEKDETKNYGYGVDQTAGSYLIGKYKKEKSNKSN